MKRRIAPLVLFDLDGTLIDSAPDMWVAINRLLAEEGRAPLALDDFRKVVSRGGAAMLGLAFPEADADATQRRLPVFLGYYAQAVAVHSRPFEGVAEVLAAIEGAGSRWGIVTNKPFWLAEPVVEGMGWSRRSAILLGGDSLPVKKPHPGQLLHACKALGVDPAETVYVGDDERDIVAARAAGMRSVAALWGYRMDGDDPAAWGGDTAAAMPLDLLAEGMIEAARAGA